MTEVDLASSPRGERVEHWVRRRRSPLIFRAPVYSGIASDPDPSLPSIGYELVRLWREERYEQLSSTRVRAISFLLGTFLIAAATTNAPISGTQQLAEGLHPVVWAGLALTLLGVVLATGSAIALTRPVVLETLEPKLANESKFQSAEEFYRAVVHYYDYERHRDAIHRRCRWQSVTATGVVFALIGGSLTWGGTLLL